MKKARSKSEAWDRVFADVQNLSLYSGRDNYPSECSLRVCQSLAMLHGENGTSLTLAQIEGIRLLIIDVLARENERQANGEPSLASLDY